MRDILVLNMVDKNNSPGQEGPSYAPPPLPEGWIAQWDGMSKKYYFVQLSTGQSQWDTPTAPAPTGPTPQATPQGVEHPYGTPGAEQNTGPQADGDRSLGGNIGVCLFESSIRRGYVLT